MKLKKILVSLGVLLCFCTSFSAVAYADMTASFPDYGISVLYENARNPVSNLSISNNTAYLTSSANGDGTAASITVTQTLQKQGFLWIWTNVKGASWSKQVTGGSIRLSNTKSGLGSGKYRVKSVFTLTDRNGESETITVYSDEARVP